MSDFTTNTPITMCQSLCTWDLETPARVFYDSYHKKIVPTFDGDGGRTGNVEAFFYGCESFVSATNGKISRTVGSPTL